MLQAFAKAYNERLQRCFDETPVEKLERIVEILREARREQRRVFFLGNGGSAATAMHMAVDFGKGTAVPGVPRLRAISLADNVGAITAWANDDSYDVVFKEQLVNLLEPGDVVIAITASGNSPNVLRAVEYARERKAITIGFIGFGGGKLKNMVDIDVTVSPKDYGVVEDFHLVLNHILSQYLKKAALAEVANARTNGNGTAVKFTFGSKDWNEPRPAIFLDRDGVINEQITGTYVTDPSQFRFVAGMPEAIARLSRLSLPIIIVSNQAAVAKGLMSYDELRSITEQFVAQVNSAGGRIDAVYYCPHSPEQDCACRKPKGGLLREAARDWQLNLPNSVLIGDSDADVNAARSVGCHAVRFGTNGNSVTLENDATTLVARDVSDIVACVERFLAAQKAAAAVVA
ncbi:MAG: HAD-IIIA family hydrolase [Terriglobales bacterium]